VREDAEHGKGDLRLVLDQLGEGVARDAVAAHVRTRANASRTRCTVVEQCELAEELAVTELDVLVVDAERDGALVDEEQAGTDRPGLDEHVSGRRVEGVDEPGDADERVAIEPAEQRDPGQPFDQRVWESVVRPAAHGGYPTVTLAVSPGSAVSTKTIRRRLRGSSSTAKLARRGVLVCALASFVASSGAPASAPEPTALEGLSAVPDPADVTIESGGLTLDASFKLPGPMLGLAFRSPTDGFMAMGSGQILHFDLRGKRLALKTAYDGLAQPRDVAYLDGKLYLTDISVPCSDRAKGFDLVRCRAKDFPGVSQTAAQVKILQDGYGVVLVFDVARDGTLSGRRVLIDDLPVATSDHGVNGITVGPDKRLYVSIGSVDQLYRFPDVVKSINRPNIDLLGTIISFKPDGSDMQVFARGLRNLYHLTFDDKGHLYGIDNDGPTLGGWRGEEAIRFVKGGHYGYPFEGTFGPFKTRTAAPMWLMHEVGSTAIEWAPRAGLPDGLLSGSCGRLAMLSFIGPGRTPRSRNHEQELLAPSGCTAVVKAAPDKRLLVGTIKPQRLLVFRAGTAQNTP
jgi:hypothetical protein